MLWHMNLPRKQRRLLLTIFTASLLSSGIGVMYLVTTQNAQAQSHNPYYPKLIAFAVHIEVGVSFSHSKHSVHKKYLSKTATTLLVCNLLVIMTYVYCLFWKEEGDNEVTEPVETRTKLNTSGGFTDLGSIPTTVTQDGSSAFLTLTEISESRQTNTSTSYPSLDIVERH
jgi:hypothetical protein